MSAAANGKIQLELVIVTELVGHALSLTVYIDEDVPHMFFRKGKALQQLFDCGTVVHLNLTPTFYPVNSHKGGIVQPDLHTNINVPSHL